MPPTCYTSEKQQNFHHCLLASNICPTEWYVNTKYVTGRNHNPQSRGGMLWAAVPATLTVVTAAPQLAKITLARTPLKRQDGILLG
jgi:hypothetical protein